MSGRHTLPFVDSDVRDELYDAVIAGGGVNGASIFQALAHAGYRVLLVDRSDFASGTSQGSAMLVWGGLLYLRDFELRTVLGLSAARDTLIQRNGIARPQRVRYVTERAGRSRAFVQGVLYAYWALGGFRRQRPRFERVFAERSLLDPSRVSGSLTYEEGRLEVSDSRFVLSCILSGRGGHAVARNYCSLTSGAFHPGSRRWRLRLDGPSWTGEIEARIVINAAGGWTDDINAVFARPSPWRHLLSKGVSICIPRDPRHTDVLACDAGPAGTTMSLVPWGPVSLWGSTDTIHADLHAARRMTGEDLSGLVSVLNAHLARPVSCRDVVSIRCGVRALAVPKDFELAGDHTRLSRHHRIHADSELPWVSVYGGKLSGCMALAADVRRQIERRIGPAVEPKRSDSRTPLPMPDGESFPGLHSLSVPVAWSMQHEQCRCVDDYLRRRTNIAQWVPRGGLGRRLEHLDHVRGIARTIHRGDVAAAERDLTRYRIAVDRDWDLLESDTESRETRSETCNR